jgi:hypothetical protein
MPIDGQSTFWLAGWPIFAKEFFGSTVQRMTLPVCAREPIRQRPSTGVLQRVWSGTRDLPCSQRHGFLIAMNLRNSEFSETIRSWVRPAIQPRVSESGSFFGCISLISREAVTWSFNVPSKS